MRYTPFAAIGLLALNMLALQRVSAKFDQEDDSPVKDALVLDAFRTAEVRPSKGVALVAVLNPTQPSLLGDFLTDSAGVRGRLDFRAIVIADNRTIGTSPHIAREGVTFVPRSGQEILTALKYTGYRSRWMILRDGRILMSGYLRDGGLPAAISSVTNGASDTDAPRREELRRTFDALYARGEIAAGPATDGREFLVIADILQTSCPLLDLIRAMNTVPLMAGRLVMTVPDSWSQGSTAALAATLDLGLPIERLSNAASAEWRRLTRDFGIGLEYGVMLVVNDKVVREVLIGVSAMREYMEAAETDKGWPQ